MSLDILVTPFGVIGGGALLATLSGFTLLGSLPVQPMATVAALGMQPHNTQISFIQVLSHECILCKNTACNQM